MTNLFKLAESENIEIIYGDIPACKSLSMDGYICMDYSTLWCGAEERVHLAHELGHCVTGSFYNRYAACDVRGRHEHRADKWAIKKLIPKDELRTAVAKGHRELWELAEYFDVTEAFMSKAVAYYKNLRR